MEKKDNMPIWVYLAFSSIKTRKAAILLIRGSLLFTIYCIPWRRFLGGDHWIGKVFLIDDWTWFVMMVPITLWYWLSLRWVDKNSTWGNSIQKET